MTRKHQTTAYRREARIVRAQVAAQHKAGRPALCWRGGGPIMPGMPYDVGHTSHGGLAPEHRHRVAGCCDGNRREGGRVGAMLTNRAPARIVHADENVTSWPV